MLSVLIAMYNEEAYILDCLQSVLDSFSDSIEIIVVDDASIDNSYNVVADYIKKNQNSKVSLYRNEQKGKVAAFNLAYTKASGSFFCFVGADDLLVKDSTMGRLITIAECEHAAISLCKIRTFSDNKELDGLIFPKRKDKGAMSGGAMLFNKAFANLAFPMPTELPNEDSWFKLVFKYMEVEIKHYPVVCYLYRQHAGNSVQLKTTFEKFSQILKLRNKAYSVFLSYFASKLHANQIDEIENYIEIENCRQKGDVVGIFFKSPKVPFREKLSFALTSNSFLYSIRLFFYRFLSGR